MAVYATEKLSTLRLSTVSEGNEIVGSPTISNLHFGNKALRYNALVDSGSDVSLLELSVFHKIEKRNIATFLMNKTVPLKSASDHAIKSVGRASVYMYINGSRYTANFILTDGFKFNVLIGSDFMNDTKAKLDFGNNTMIIGNRVICLRNKFDVPDCSLLEAASTQYVDPYSVTHIKVRSRLTLQCTHSAEKGDYIITPLDNSNLFYEQPGLLAPSLTVNKNISGMYTMPVVNSTGIRYTVNKRMVVGFIESVDLVAKNKINHVYKISHANGTGQRDTVMSTGIALKPSVHSDVLHRNSHTNIRDYHKHSNVHVPLHCSKHNSAQASPHYSKHSKVHVSPHNNKRSSIQVPHKQTTCVLHCTSQLGKIYTPTCKHIEAQGDGSDSKCPHKQETTCTCAFVDKCTCKIRNKCTCIDTCTCTCTLKKCTCIDKCTCTLNTCTCTLKKCTCIDTCTCTLKKCTCIDTCTCTLKKCTCIDTCTCTLKKCTCINTCTCTLKKCTCIDTCTCTLKKCTLKKCTCIDTYTCTCNRNKGTCTCIDTCTCTCTCTCNRNKGTCTCIDTCTCTYTDTCTCIATCTCTCIDTCTCITDTCRYNAVCTLIHNKSCTCIQNGLHTHKHNPTYNDYVGKETNVNKHTLNTNSYLQNGKHFGTYGNACPGVVKNMKDYTDAREKVQLDRSGNNKQWSDTCSNDSSYNCSEQPNHVQSISTYNLLEKRNKNTNKNKLIEGVSNLKSNRAALKNRSLCVCLSCNGKLCNCNCSSTYMDTRGLNKFSVNNNEKQNDVHSDKDLSCNATHTNMSKDVGLNTNTYNTTVAPRVNSIYKVKRSDFNIGSHIDDQQCQTLLRILNKFNYLFVDNVQSLRQTNVLQATFDTGNSQPIRQRPYKNPLAYEKDLEKEINDMLEAGIISPSSSAWSSPIVIVPKRDNTIRVCIDYRQLNKTLVKDSYPLPRIDDIFATLGKTKFFTSIDLKSGYHNIAVAPQDREKTAFCTRTALYHFNVLPFGLCNSPAIFSRMISKVLHGIEGKFAMAYLDDILVFSRTFDEHIEHLKDVFTRLKKANLCLNRKKCHFVKKEVEYLGHLIGPNGIKPNPEKVRVIQTLEPPINVRGVRSFIGMVSYYRKYIPQFSEIARPLTNLTRKNVKFEWNDDTQQAFDFLKKKLTEAPILGYPDVTRPYSLYTDASEYSIGGILTQDTPEGERVIEYVSHQLTQNRLHYPVIQKECFAIVYCLTKLRQYLLGAQTTVYTDHKPLKSLFTAEMKNTRIQRWAILFDEYQVKIKYREGRHNVRADMLSRLRIRPTEGEIEQSNDILAINAESEDDNVRLLSYDEISFDDDIDLKALQRKDKHCKLIFQQIKDKDNEKVANDYVVQNHLLYHVGKTNRFETDPILQLVIPIRLKRVVLQGYHSALGGGHVGLEKTYQKNQIKIFLAKLLQRYN